MKKHEFCSKCFKMIKKGEMAIKLHPPNKVYKWNYAHRRCLK